MQGNREGGAKIFLRLGPEGNREGRAKTFLRLGPALNVGK